MLAFGSLLLACIVRSNSTKRLGTRELGHNCLSGMAGQLALTILLRSCGFDAKMIAPTHAHGDPGFDVCLGSGDTTISFEVRTSSFADNRGSELMRLGDRFPLRDGIAAPDFYAWCVTQPRFFADLAYFRYIDVFAIIPAGEMRPTTRRPVTAVPGKRLREIGTEFSILWLLEVLKDARESEPLIDTLRSFEGYDLFEILDDPWVACYILGMRGKLTQRYDETTLAIAQDAFKKLGP